MGTKLSIACVSWIDPTRLPKVEFQLVKGAATSWVNRVIMGLAATANRPPGPAIPSISVFRRSKQYRAIQSCVIDLTPVVRISEQILDPGFTPPPVDLSMFDIEVGSFKWEWLESHPGETSAISGILPGRLHPSSSIALKNGDNVVASGLLKFRAGETTDWLGTTLARSPVHVPWVWSEFALVSNQSDLRLICKAAAFPSHTWYVNGKQVAGTAQALVTASEHDPILTTGRPASGLQSHAKTDKHSGDIVRHADTIGATAQIDVPLKLN